MFIVSHLNLPHIPVSTYPKKLLLIRFILSVVLERTVTFLTTGDVGLDECTNYLSNNKWLGVKHISIVFG